MLPAPRREGGTKVRCISQEKAQASRCQYGSRQLRGPVPNQPPQREMPRQHKTQGDGRVKMGPADMAERVDHHGNHQAKHQTHSHMRHLAARQPVDHDRSASCKNEGERSNPLGDERSTPGDSFTLACRHCAGARSPASSITCLCMFSLS